MHFNNLATIQETIINQTQREKKLDRRISLPIICFRLFNKCVCLSEQILKNLFYFFEWKWRATTRLLIFALVRTVSYWFSVAHFVDKMAFDIRLFHVLA